MKGRQQFFTWFGNQLIPTSTERTSTQSTMKELLQQHLYEKTLTQFFFSRVFILSLSLSVSTYGTAYLGSSSGSPPRISRNRTWAPHRGHRPGSPGTPPGLLIGVIAPDLPEPHLSSSTGSSPRISRNRILGLLIGVIPLISRNRTWAPHRGHPPDLPEPHLGSSSGSSPRISRNRTRAPHRGHCTGSPQTAPGLHRPGSPGSTWAFCPDRLGLLLGSAWASCPDRPGPPTRIHLGLLPSFTVHSRPPPFTVLLSASQLCTVHCILFTYTILFTMYYSCVQHCSPGPNLGPAPMPLIGLSWAYCLGLLFGSSHGLLYLGLPLPAPRTCFESIQDSSFTIPTPSTRKELT
ncbi:hypothetical protein ACOSQ4_009164 [Xanthoceras sorbifolium]